MPDTFAFTHIILPLLIFVARICDVTLGTLRIIFVSKGYKAMAPLLGFFEVLIWVIVISQLLSSFSSWVCYIAYAGGFAMGNFVGMIIEERIAIGTLLVRITTPKDARGLVNMLSEKGFGATLLEGKGAKGRVNIIQSVVSRKSIKDIQQILDDYDPNLFYSIEDVRSVTKGVFPSARNINSRWKVGK
ncbi:DUF2179 domain-containing protein [Paludibacter sp. 221]|nr:DUF2179 domain-containing protein [Paludibacter sp. 221]